MILASIALLLFIIVDVSTAPAVYGSAEATMKELETQMEYLKASEELMTKLEQGQDVPVEEYQRVESIVCEKVEIIPGFATLTEKYPGGCDDTIATLEYYGYEQKGNFDRGETTTILLELKKTK